MKEKKAILVRMNKTLFERISKIARDNNVIRNALICSVLETFCDEYEGRVKELKERLEEKKESEKQEERVSA
jgi:hypothetical protein